MLCPNCQQENTLKKINSVVYYCCLHCFALWFDNKDTDFLTLEETKTLNKTISSEVNFKQPLICPNCRQTLNETSPNWFQCYKCGGVLTTARNVYQDRLNKLNNSQINGITKKQLQNVVLFGSILFFLLINVFIINNLNREGKNVQAQILGSNIKLQKLENGQNVLFFTTEEPLYSIAYLKKTDNTISTLKINYEQPDYTHLLTFSAPKNSILEIELLDTTYKIKQHVRLNLD